MKRVCVVGGGFGGLVTAYFLERKCGASLSIRMFEASNRTGGKILTQRFESAPAMYEAGVAELYNYTTCGPDPLMDLVQTFGLKTIQMKGQAVVLKGRVLRSPKEIGALSIHAVQALQQFRKRAREAITLEEWYEGNFQYDNSHPWARVSCEEVLGKVADPIARNYLRVAVHSDLATEPHLTNGLNGLKNFVMDVPGYIGLYSLTGGIEELPKAVSNRLSHTSVLTEASVVSVKRLNNRAYRVFYSRRGQLKSEDFDALFIALPHNWLGTIDWQGETLSSAMGRFIAYYDRPAHYLRVSVLFQEPFWRKQISGSWFTLDSFGGCCVYDETLRYPTPEHGVLGWLLAGASALSLCNLDDATLAETVLKSLPNSLYRIGRKSFIEAKVHRWAGAVSAQPGGLPVQNTRSAHIPEPCEHPDLFMVGDYLFDSTLNGVLDSADCATDLFRSWLLTKRMTHISGASSKNRPHSVVSGRNGSTNGRHVNRHVKGPGLAAKRGGIDRAYFDHYHNGHSYNNTFDQYFDAEYVITQIDTVWRVKPPYRLLDAGSANGLTLQQFAKFGIEAWGIERNRYIHKATPKVVKERNLLGDVRRLSFENNYFDFVYETCLNYLPEREIEPAIKELHRVTKHGLVFGSITSDMNPKLFRRSDLLWGAKTLMPLWEWSELFIANGFTIAVADEQTLMNLWRCECKYNAGDDDWYPDQKSLRYCFYAKA